MRFNKYSGAGNTFTVIDGRSEKPTDMLNPAGINLICSQFSTDGLMVLCDSDKYDFTMEYYNSDGSGGMMCGNGGRCIISFAESLGIKPANGNIYRFEASDGVHEGEILHRDGATDIVRLKMSDVLSIKYFEELEGAPVDGYFLNTGCPHFVIFDDEVADIDVMRAGSVVRHAKEFAPTGTNVDFVMTYEEGIKLRTFEKGVEGETLACGTGVVASAIAAYFHGIPPSSQDGKSLHYKVRTVSDDLSVDFIPARIPESLSSTGSALGTSSEPVAREIFITGPATFVFCTL